MKIQKVELKYFKFHKNLAINFDGKSLLIYGENGTGKSSIYEALYSNFYHQQGSTRDTYLTRKYPSEELEVNITFDNTQMLNRRDDNLSSKSVLANPTVYFANEKVLNRLTKENFYIALQDTLVEHFPTCKELIEFYRDFNNIETLKTKIIDEIKTQDDIQILGSFNAKIANANTNFEAKFKELIIEDEINDILKNHFDESFKISFPITPAQSGDSDILEFNPPVIKVKIDDIDCNGKLSQHFNEAKLKLIGAAIYFSLAKKYENSGDGFKLLVLDDFLTSLDMSNRKLIMKYILEEFKEYQKLILTHNLQFFNMARKMINLNSEDAKQWKVQKLFVYDNQAFLYDKDISYLKEANESLARGDEHSAGNFIRKEFERIVTEFEQLLELGKVEELQKIIDALKSKDKHYVHSYKLTNNFYEKVKEILDDVTKTESLKIENIKSAFKPLNDTTIEFNEEIKNADSTVKITIKALIKRGEFYKNFILNPTSHDDIEVEIYKKECENAINILKHMNTIVNNLKGKKYS